MRKRFIMAALLGAAVSAGASQAHAGTLGLISGVEDFTVNAVRIQYVFDSTTEQGALTITGTTVDYDGAGLTGSSKGTVTINAVLSSTGSVISGSGTVKGSTTGSAATTQYSSSTLAGFSSANDDQFELLFDENSTPGTLASSGQYWGVIVTAKDQIELSETPYSLLPTPAFNVSFDNYVNNVSGPADSTADAFYVPEPASLSLLGIGAIALLGKRRAKRA